jgi:hypothetical protein
MAIGTTKSSARKIYIEILCIVRTQEKCLNSSFPSPLTKRFPPSSLPRPPSKYPANYRSYPTFRPPVGARIDGAQAINTKNAKSRFFLKQHSLSIASQWHPPRVAQAALLLQLVLLENAKLILLKRSGFTQPTTKITRLNYFVRLRLKRRLLRV